MPLLAYFLTWTTYGTWLHGDERGAAADIHGKSVRVDADDERHGWSSSLMAEDPFTLDEEARAVVPEAIRRHAEHRGWHLGAINVRSNHVHLVIRAPGYSPEIVVSQLKSWATRELRSRGSIENRTHVWTKKASTRWINDEKSHAAAVDYVLNHQ